MLTQRDANAGPPFLIVGTRARIAGSLVLGSATTPEAAAQLADMFRRHLEGYSRIDVERVQGVRAVGPAREGYGAKGGA